MCCRPSEEGGRLDVGAPWISDMKWDDAGASASLYRRLLGDAWPSAPESIRAMHVDISPVRATGAFRILHGANPVARLVARLLGMPAAGEVVPTRLVVFRDGSGERWMRRFGRQMLITTQDETATALLRERFGVLEFRFR